MLICLAFWAWSGSWNVAMFGDSFVITSVSLDVMLFMIMTWAIVPVAFLARRIFTPESVIASLFF